MRSLPRVVSQIPSDLRSFLDRVREYLSEGGENRFVTVRELRAGGIVGTTPGGTITTPEDYQAVDPTIPEGLTTSSGLACVFVSWTAANYLGHSHTEIWASTTNSFALKELVGTSEGNLFTHNLGDGGSRYYWIRFVNINEVAGPYNSLTGTVGIAGTDPAYLLDVLAGSITDAELSTALNTQIDTNTTQITSVRNLYTVKMDNQGYLTGFGLMSNLANGGVPTTDFFVNANRFAVTTPTTSIPARTNSTSYSLGAFVGVASSTSKMLVCKVAGTSGGSAPNIAATAIGVLVTDGTVTWQVASRVPLSVLTTTATINGVVVPPGVYIDGASIVNATITNAAIGDAAITDAKIQTATITDAKIANLSVGKLTAAALQVGSFIQSQGYVTGTSGWKIDSTGVAEFSQATVRGSLFGGAATAYATGVGLFSGLDSSIYKFRVGNPGGNQFTWDGSALTVTGTISGGTILGGSATAYTTGTGLFSGLDGGVYKWRVGNPTGARVQWDGSAIYVYNTSNQVTIASGNIDYSVITGTKPPADADKTSANIAAGITGQTGFATLSSITSTNASTYIAGLALNTPQLANNSVNSVFYTAGMSTNVVANQFDNQFVLYNWTVPSSAVVGSGTQIDAIISFTVDIYNQAATSFPLGLRAFAITSGNVDTFVQTVPARLTTFSGASYPSYAGTGQYDLTIHQRYYVSNLTLGGSYTTQIGYATGATVSASCNLIYSIQVQLLKK